MNRSQVRLFLNFYRQPSEAWAWWKRTGFPNTTSAVPWDDLKGNGNVLVMPRRALLVPAVSVRCQL